MKIHKNSSKMSLDELQIGKMYVVDAYTLAQKPALLIKVNKKENSVLFLRIDKFIEIQVEYFNCLPFTKENFEIAKEKFVRWKSQLIYGVP